MINKHVTFIISNNIIVMIIYIHQLWASHLLSCSSVDDQDIDIILYLKTINIKGHNLIQVTCDKVHDIHV